MRSDYCHLIKLSQIDKEINHLERLKVISDNELDLDNYFRKISVTSTHRDNIRNEKLQRKNVVCVFNFAQKNFIRAERLNNFVLNSVTFTKLPIDCLYKICNYII